MVSLVVPTLHRVSELDRLLCSLDRQSYKDFEVIVVDQNPDDRLASTLARHPGLKLVHMRCPLGASRARNVGIRVARRQIIAFPDDDCWYPEHLLRNVVDWFGSHPDRDGLFGMLRDSDNISVGPRWPAEGPCTHATLWVGGITPVAFLRCKAVQSIGLFDERIGPGATSGYHSGEDADYFLRGLKNGLRMWHDPALTVHHPSFHAPERLRDKSYSYSLGGGYILREYGYSRRIVFRMLFRSMGGALLRLFQGNMLQTQAYLVRTAGLTRGYLLGRKDILRSSMSAANTAPGAATGSGLGPSKTHDR